MKSKIRIIFLTISIIVGTIGCYLLSTTFDKSDSYSYPKMVLFGSIFFIFWSLLHIFQVTINFENFKKKKFIQFLLKEDNKKEEGRTSH